jgi:hypothetical protein
MEVVRKIRDEIRARVRASTARLATDTLTRFLCEWSSYYSRVKGSFCPNPNRAPRMDTAEHGKSGRDGGLQIFDLI